MRFGVGLGADTTPEALPGIVDHLEHSGADSVWFSELVYSPAVDPFIGMAYTLSRTTRLKAGTSVAILPGRHPVLVAKQVASLAALAPKRVLPVFGLHSALPAERDVFTVPRGRRGAVFDESLEHRAIEPDHYGISLAVATGAIPDHVYDTARRRRPEVDPAELIAADWSTLHRRVDEYVEAGLTKFVIRAVGSGDREAFLERFVGELLPRQN